MLKLLKFILGLTLWLKGEKNITDNREVNINDLPKSGCRRYKSLECRSDVLYPGIIDREKAYWIYRDPITLKDYMVDDIRCKVGDKCEHSNIGWRSARGLYRNGKMYYIVVRLGKVSDEAKVGLFTCHIEGDSKSLAVSVKIIDCESNDKISRSFFIGNIAFCFPSQYL